MRRKGLDQKTPFGFFCKRCLQCCRSKKIQVNPYEIARLAGNLGISTTDFISGFTHSGTHLKQDDDGVCLFLDSQGCSVHKDRPLVCRLYPLGRHIDISGKEGFSEFEQEAGCKGIYSEETYIFDYLNSQGAGPFMEAADRYLSLLWRLLEIVGNISEPANRSAVLDTVRDFAEGVNNRSLWADMDATVGSYCEKYSAGIPLNIEEKMSLHIKAIEMLTYQTQGEES